MEDYTSRDLFILLPLIYLFPSYVLYILELLVLTIYQNSVKFSGSFIQIFFVYSVNNILASVVYFLTFRGTDCPSLFKFYESLPKHHFLITLTVFLTFLTGAYQIILDVCISLNRFTVIILGNRHNEFWMKWVNVIVFGSLIISLIIVWPIWTVNVGVFYIIPEDPTAGYIWGFIEDFTVPWPSMQTLAALNIFICGTLSFLMNGYVCYFLLKVRWRKVQTNSIPKLSNHDIRLIIFNFLIFGAQIIQLGLQVSLF